MSGLSDSKYINNIEEKVFKAVSVIFIISAIVMPPYFGISAPGFDLTAVRMLIIALMIMMCAKRERLYDFLPMIKYNGVFLATAPYIFVITYTMVLRTDLKAFLNPFIEFLILFLAIYVIRSTLGVETTIKKYLPTNTRYPFGDFYAGQTATLTKCFISYTSCITKIRFC